MYYFNFVFSCTVISCLMFNVPVDSCNGFKLYVDYFRNCGGNDVMEISDDFRPILNEDCTITMNGCIKMKKTVETSFVSYDFIRNGKHHSGSKNTCQLMSTARGDILAVMDALDAPRFCPIKPGNYCGQGRQVSIRRSRVKLPMMTGTTVGKIEFDTNVGKSCLEFSATLKKASRFERH